ncbi:MAG: macro domain-containing protein [Candidatus Cloacimonas sp.]|jgi:O-acetyl-ADP-ribose deacetylase (regulator of RNase III)|nr:macro domain-containing protein [Candidatus Cloacimonas sp.]
MVKVNIGDILSSTMQTKVNTVNCVGVMGKGIAKLFKQKYPEMYDDYVDRCKTGEVEEGFPYLYEDIFGNKILNFPTKDHWKGLSKLESIIKGLDIFVLKYKEWRIQSIAFPPLGCGNGGLSWQQVGPVMYQKLSAIDIPIEIYAPWGTEKKYLSKEFLETAPNNNIAAKHVVKEVPDGWFVILEVLYRLENLKYAPKVGATVFQKICYMATLSGISTGLQFKKGAYGPFSPDIQKMYLVFGRENLIKVKNINNMQMIETGLEYPTIQYRLKDSLLKFDYQITRLVDIFSRIKSTDQAEEVGTIMFALDELTHHGVHDLITELDFYKYVLNWKKGWDNPQKRESLAATIRYLTSLEWIRLDFSDELPV